MWLTSSSIGRKLIMAVTGAFLILFVTFHALMNGVALFWPTAYNVVCEFLGANWYALVGTVIIAAAVVLHIVYAVWLTVQNRKARGHERYNVTSKPASVEWSSKNMLVLGIVVLAFLVLHFIQFWAKMQFAEICEFKPETITTINGMEVAVSPAAGTFFLQKAFSSWVVFAAYAVGFIALWFHLTHGFWSMFQSSGWNGRIWMPRLQKIGNCFITFIIGLFLAEALVFTIQAHRNYYLENPELNQQYIEMALKHNGSADAPVTAATPCGKLICGEAACGNPACGTGECTDAACCQDANACCSQPECCANNEACCADNEACCQQLVCNNEACAATNCADCTACAACAACVPANSNVTNN